MQPTLRHADTVVATRAEALLPRAVYVAVLPTNNRQQFALLETTGRISLHPLSRD